MKAKGSSGTIQHEGTVQKVESDSVVVRISSASACAGCHAEGFCSLSGKEEKTVNITGRYNVAAGDAITVLMNVSSGFKAVILSYLVPLIILVISLIVLTSFSVKELTSGLVSIAVLAPYFLTLYLFRNRINRRFNFTLKR